MTGHASDRRPTSPGAVGPSRSLGAQRLTPTEPAPAAAVDETVVTVEGDLDLTGAERLRPVFQDAVAPRRRLVLELSSVTHVCATALAVLVAGHRRLRDAGGALVLRSPSAAVVRELRISGLHRVIAVDPPDRDVSGSGPA